MTVPSPFQAVELHDLLAEVYGANAAELERELTQSADHADRTLVLFARVGCEVVGAVVLRHLDTLPLTQLLLPLVRADDKHVLKALVSYAALLAARHHNSFDAALAMLTHDALVAGWVFVRNAPPEWLDGLTRLSHLPSDEVCGATHSLQHTCVLNKCDTLAHCDVLA